MWHLWKDASALAILPFATSVMHWSFGRFLGLGVEKESLSLLS